MKILKISINLTRKWYPGKKKIVLRCTANIFDFNSNGILQSWFPAHKNIFATRRQKDFLLIPGYAKCHQCHKKFREEEGFFGNYGSFYKDAVIKDFTGKIIYYSPCNYQTSRCSACQQHDRWKGLEPFKDAVKTGFEHLYLKISYITL